MSESEVPGSPAPPPLPPTLPKPKKKSFWRTPTGVFSIVGITLAGLLFVGFACLGFAIQLGYLPDSEAVAAEHIPEHLLATLRDAEILEAGEQVRYYYCSAIFDYLEDGNLFTDRRVISYWMEYGSVVVEAAAYGEIADIDVEPAGSWFDDATITIERSDGSQFELYVAGENDGDTRFAEALELEWRRHR